MKTPCTIFIELFQEQQTPVGKANCTHYENISLYHYILLCNTHNGNSLTCFEIMHHHDAAGLAVVAGYPLGTVSGGRCRGSFIEADIHKEQSKVEPAGYRLKGELSISTLSCLSVLSEFQPTLTEWMVESYLPPIRGMPQLLIRSSSLSIFSSLLSLFLFPYFLELSFLLP